DVGLAMQPRQIDDVEPGDRDALHQDRLDVRAEARRDELDHAIGRVRAVAPDPARDHAVEPRARAHRADEPDVAAMLVRERRIVEADHVRQRACRHLSSVWIGSRWRACKKSSSRWRWRATTILNMVVSAPLISA